MKKHPITHQFWIDEELRILAYKTPASRFWYIRFNLPGAGQRKQSLKTTSVKQARILGSKIARDFVTGDINARRKSRMTIEEVGQLRVERLKAAGEVESTLADHRRTNAKLVAWGKTAGVRFIDQLIENRMESLETTLREFGVALPVENAVTGKRKRKHVPKPLGPSYLRQNMKRTRGLILFALRRRLIDKDPCPAYKLPPEPHHEADHFTPEELTKIYGDEPEMSEIWQFLVHTCLRRLEFCWLQKQDVVLDDQQHPVAIRIRRKVCPLTGKKWRPKHGVERDVPLTEKAAEIVKLWLASFDTPWLCPGPGRPTAHGGRWTGDDLLFRLRSRLDVVGIKHGVLHTFRHTGASLLANDAEHPMPLPSLQRFLGHKSIKTTQMYLHVRIDDVAAALRRTNLDGPATTHKIMVTGTPSTSRSNPIAVPPAATADSTALMSGKEAKQQKAS